MASTGLLRPHQSRVSLAQRVVVALLILGTLYAATHLPRVDLSQEIIRNAYTQAGLLAVVTYSFCAEFSRLYSSWRGSSIRAEVGRAIWCWTIVVITLLGLGFATKTSIAYSRVAMSLWFIVHPSCRSSASSCGSRRATTVATTEVGAVVLGSAQQSARRSSRTSFGIVSKGHFDDTGDVQTGTLDELVALCSAGKIDVVYMALPLERSRQIRDLTDRLQNSTASIYLVPDLLVFDLMQARVQHLGDVPVISILESPFLGIDGTVKRLEDIILGALILALITLPMLFIALAVKLTSRGPVFFKQRRYGLNGKQISVWFRSMTVSKTVTRSPKRPKATHESPP